MIPRATYRFQFNRDFPFARAEELVPYLDRLGISHVYASPITTARAGSSHGYDVIEPTRVNPELGGEDALRSLVAALRARDMGLIIDIVPNHMGVAGGGNAWWNDVLAHGQASEYARFFDIDWSEPLLLPILGAPLEDVLADGQIAIDRSGFQPTLTFYGEHRVPLSPESRGDLPKVGDKAGLAALLERQHYRLGWWRLADDELNWRRFFTISELAGLRVEDPDVFEETHALYFRLWREGLIDGVRIDHVDGLVDPASYCRKLRRRFEEEARDPEAPSGPAYIVVEKILGPGETMPGDWGIDGTSGYDFMEDVAALLHDPRGEADLSALWTDSSGRTADFAAEELRARQDMLSWAFAGQFDRCIDAFAALAASSAQTASFSRSMLRRALERLLWVFPVYRTYGTGSDAPPGDARIRRLARERVEPFLPPGEAHVTDAVLAWLAGEGEGDPALALKAVARFQQLSSPIAAKAVEDTAFYRYGRLLSRTDVGFDPAHFAMSVPDFHRACMARAAQFPHAMLTTATHDHKRGEDTRARLAVLSADPELWQRHVREWDALAGPDHADVHPGDRYTLYQSLFGAWPDGLDPDDREGVYRFAERMKGWQEKALREAKLRSSWTAPDSAYEARCMALVEYALMPAGELARGIAGLVRSTSPATLSNMLVQAALRMAVPGVPDCYQGTELPDYSLVDPDNRRPVDYDLRRDMLDRMPEGREVHPKMRLIAAMLRARREDPALFAGAGYDTVSVEGARADDVIAFERTSGGRRLSFAAALRCGRALIGGDSPVPGPGYWGDTSIMFAGKTIAARECFAHLPVFAARDGETLALD